MTVLERINENLKDVGVFTAFVAGFIAGWVLHSEPPFREVKLEISGPEKAPLKVEQDMNKVGKPDR